MRMSNAETPLPDLDTPQVAGLDQLSRDYRRMEFILDWLDDEGFEVSAPKYIGRAVIRLEPRKK